MTDRPILFSAPMVRALLDGRKTQTRRLFKPRGFEFYTHPVSGDRYNEYQPYRDGTWDGSRIVGSGPMQAFGWGEGLYSYLPYAPGDRLWVKETWRANYGLDLFNEELDRCPRPTDMDPKTTAIEYLADGERELGGKTRVSIHMPRWASRLTLLVTEVRVEQLQNCSEADAIAEGVPTEMEGEVGHEIYCPTCQGMGVHGALGHNLGVIEVDCADCQTAAQRYRNLWNHINGAGAWEANPWVVAVTFTVEKRNIDA